MTCFGTSANCSSAREIGTVRLTPEGEVHWTTFSIFNEYVTKNLPTCSCWRSISKETCTYLTFGAELMRNGGAKAFKSVVYDQVVVC